MSKTPPSSSVIGPVPASRGPARASSAATPRDYRKDAATHLYGLNTQRIYKGRLPPMLYAIGTLNVDIDATGRVTALRWMRSPQHAPEVVAEIERTVRSISATTSGACCGARIQRSAVTRPVASMSTFSVPMAYNIGGNLPL